MNLTYFSAGNEGLLRVSKDALFGLWLVVAQLQTLPPHRLHQMLHQGKSVATPTPKIIKPTKNHKLQMRIPSDQFDTVDVSEVTWYGANADKLEQSSPVVSSSSLFSSFQLKLPQFRLRSPNGGMADCCESSESTPTSPVLSRRGSERRKQTLAQPPQTFLHQALSRHQSLSTNNTPAR